jgi:hypothetical protein
MSRGANHAIHHQGTKEIKSSIAANHLRTQRFD